MNPQLSNAGNYDDEDCYNFETDAYDKRKLKIKCPAVADGLQLYVASSLNVFTAVGDGFGILIKSPTVISQYIVESVETISNSQHTRHSR